MIKSIVSSLIRRRITHYTFLLVAGLAGFDTAYGASAATVELSVDGRDRSYLFVSPGASTPRPLVLVLHGGIGNANRTMNITGWNDEAERRGWIVAYPNGTGRNERFLTWNAGECCGSAMKEQVDDVAFIRAVIRDVSSRVPVDRERIYVTGMSNGAMLSYKLACEMSDTIAAIAPVAAGMNYAGCRPADPVSVLHIHGTNDQNAPYHGGVGKKALEKAPKHPIPDVIAEWRRLDGCGRATESRITQDASISRTACRDGTEVSLITIEGGGHAWPGGQKAGRIGDDPSQYTDATRISAEFFARSTLTKRP